MRERPRSPLSFGPATGHDLPGAGEREPLPGATQNGLSL